MAHQMTCATSPKGAGSALSSAVGTPDVTNAHVIGTTIAPTCCANHQLGERSLPTFVANIVLGEVTS